MTAEFDEQRPRITELSKAQRRVLGVLVEKAYTTPEYYPLTLKAVTSGCNQKSNRHPVTNYDEDRVEETLEQLREMGLVGEVHTESGRTARYRHYMRKRFPFTEPQLAIVVELLLRGRQQLGELRTRASRMVAIDSQEQLRDELAGLLEQSYIQANGPLERRGIEVDHNLYPASEGMALGAAAATPERAERASPETSDANVEQRLAALETHTADLRADFESLRAEFAQLRESLDRFRSELGG